MLCLIIISVLIALAVARTPRVIPTVPIFDGRIVGGEATTIEQHPYQLSLQYYGSHSCGASILSPTKALTAAHCTDGKSASDLSVRAGTSIRGSGGQVVQVKSICQHPGYHQVHMDTDVSVLTLASELILGPGVQLISTVNLGQQINADEIATVSGWGRLESGGSLPSQLMKVDVPNVDRKKCQQLYVGYIISKNMLCFGYVEEGGKDSCQGDSGGPLVYKGQQIGVVSWGLGCAAAGYPGVYADLSAKSIVDHIKTCDV